MSKKIELAQSHKRKAKGKAIHSNELLFSKLFSITIIIILMVGIAINGLLHERNYLTAIIILGCISILFLGWNIFSKREINLRSIQILLGCGFVLVYGLSLISAVYTRSAVLSLSKYLGVLILIMLIHNLKDKAPFDEWLLKGYYLAGIILAVLGLDGIWGGKLIALLQSVANITTSEEGGELLKNLLIDNGRLGSLFHYPNTSAAFLLVAWVIGIAKWNQAKGLHSKILIGSTTGIIAAAFVLTLSRGAYLMAVPVMIIAILLLPKDNRAFFAASLFGSSMIAVLLGITFWPGSETRSMGMLGWGVAVLVTSLVSAAISAIQSRLARIKEKTTDMETLGTKLKKYKKIWLGAILGCFILALIVLGIAWFWMEPIRLDVDQDMRLQRIFSLDQPGEYSLHLEFSEPLDQAALQQLRISLISQTPKEMFLRKSKNLIDVQLREVQNLQSNVFLIPFQLNEDQFATETLTIQGNMGKSPNKIISIAVVNSESNESVQSLRLRRKLISDSVSDRIENMFMLRSAFMRISFYRDALEMFKDSPLTGAGGGAWEHLYYEYQDYHYISSDVHSYAFQLLVESGVFGILLLLFTIAALVWKLADLWRKPVENQILIWLGAVILLVHSLIDFDFAYYSTLLIFWALMSLLDIPMTWAKAAASPKKRWPISLLCLVLVLGSSYWPFRLILATDYAGQYMEAASDNNAVASERFIRKAIALDPFKADYKVALASLLVLRNGVTKEGFVEGQQLAEAARTQAEHEYLALEKLSDYYQKSVQWEKAYEVETRITAIKPLEPAAWEFKGRMIQNAIEWYSQTDKVKETEKKEQLALWLDRSLAIQTEMEKASAGKLEEVKPTKELKTLLEAWLAKQTELHSNREVATDQIEEN